MKYVDQIVLYMQCNFLKYLGLPEFPKGKKKVISSFLRKARWQKEKLLIIYGLFDICNDYITTHYKRTLHHYQIKSECD